MLKIAVIGTAGRGEDQHRLKPEDFERMTTIVKGIIQSLTKDPYVVSGGAAWADHVAVALFIQQEIKHLHLHLPAEFDLDEKRYVDNGIRDYKRNPGGTANYYMDLFKQNSYETPNLDIAYAIEQGAKVTVGNGFHDRNNQVANVDVVIALTFGDGAKLKDGGTADTFQKYLSRAGKKISFHVDLNTWIVYSPATL
jgi:hypothetical protein